MKGKREMQSHVEPVGASLFKEAGVYRRQWRQAENISIAETMFRQVAQQSPNLWMAHFGLGEVLSFKAEWARARGCPPAEETEAVRELRKAAELAPTEPEPLLKLAACLSRTDLAAAQDLYERAVESLKVHPARFYPRRWQAGDHWRFAIAAADGGLEDLAVEAFGHAIELNEEFAGKLMPSSGEANACWQTALRKLGRTEWFQRQKEEREAAEVIDAGLASARRQANLVEGRAGALALGLSLAGGLVAVWWHPFGSLHVWPKVGLTVVAGIVAVLLSCSVCLLADWLYWRYYFYGGDIRAIGAGGAAACLTLTVALVGVWWRPLGPSAVWVKLPLTVLALMSSVGTAFLVRLVVNVLLLSPWLRQMRNRHR